MKDKDFIEVSEFIQQQRSSFLSTGLLERATETGFIQAAQLISQSSGMKLEECRDMYEVSLGLSLWVKGIYGEITERMPYPEIVKILELRHEFRNLRLAFKDYLAPTAPPVYTYIGHDPDEISAFFNHKDPFETTMPDYLLKTGQQAIKMAEEGETLEEIVRIFPKAMFAEMMSTAEKLENEFITDMVRTMIDFQNSQNTLKVKAGGEPLKELEGQLVENGKTQTSFFIAAYKQPLIAAIPAIYHKRYGDKINYAVEKFEHTEDFGYFSNLFRLIQNAMAQKVEIVAYGAEVPFTYLMRVEYDAYKARVILSSIKEGKDPDTIKSYLQLDIKE